MPTPGDGFRSLLPMAVLFWALALVCAATKGPLWVPIAAVFAGAWLPAAGAWFDYRDSAQDDPEGGNR